MKTSIGFPLRFGGAGANRMVTVHSQRGLVLLFTLIILVAMTLAGIALVRSVDTSTMIAGNLAFRQSAEASGSQAVELAAGFISNSANLLAGPAIPNSGYYPTRATQDLTGNRTPTDTTDDLNWAAAPSVGPDAAGNTAFYVINRLCDSVGPLDPNTCSIVASNSSAGKSYGSVIREAPYKGDMTGLLFQGYYSVTVKVIGPRNTVSYTQAILVF